MLTGLDIRLELARPDEQLLKRDTVVFQKYEQPGSNDGSSLRVSGHLYD